MTAGVVLLNFGEPAEPTRAAVVEYLERIFFNNASLEDADSEEARERARELAERRAPGLIGEYEAIGGSPLIPQAKAQADVLETELADRGYDATTYVGMQFTEPSIPEAVDRAHADGVDRLVGLPIYPFCGQSTTIDALSTLGDAVDALDWDVTVDELTGWHRHPTYNRLRAENLVSFADDRGLSLDAADTTVVFSAHGTPRRYIEAGNRYDRYVEEYCDVIAKLLGIEEYDLGYQNHANRGDVAWTEPEVESVVEGLADSHERVVVDPISFMHEQSETLSELDIDLREDAESVGLEFHRVPVPHDDDRFADVLADLAEPFLASFDPGYYQFRQCQCKATPGTMCLNAPQQ